MYLSAIKTYPLDTSLVSEAEKRFAKLKTAKLAYLKLNEDTDLWLRSLCPNKLEGHEGVSLTEDGILVINEGGGNGLTDILKRGKLSEVQYTSFTTE